MYIYRADDGTVTRAVIAHKDNVKATEFLRGLDDIPYRLGWRFGLATTPFTMGGFVTWIILTPHPATQANIGPVQHAFEAVAASFFVGGMLSFFLGFIFWLICDLRAGGRFREMLNSGTAIDVHPLLLRHWQKEIERQGLTLSAAEFERELAARFDFFGNLERRAHSLAHPLTDRRLKAKLARQIRTELRNQGELLQISCAPRLMIERATRDAHNDGVAAEFGLTAD